MILFDDLVFSQSSYTVSVAEDVAKGMEVLRVSATDVDEGPNANITFDIRDAPDLTFSISKTSGSIFTTGSLDRELNDQVVIDLSFQIKDKV